MLKRTITWVSSMSYIGKTCRKHWPNITRTWISVGATIVLSGSSARRDDKPARLARHVTAQRAYCRFSDSSRLSRESRLARLPIRPRPPEGAPVRSPIGAWPHHIGVDTGGHVFRSGPNLHTLDVDDGIGIVRFIQWQRDGAGDLPGHGDSGSVRDGRGIEEFSVDGDEAAL